MTEREKMLAGELYDCGDQELIERWHKAKNLVREYNRINSENLAEKEKVLSELLGGKGKNLWITAPFFVDYGNNIYFAGAEDYETLKGMIDENTPIKIVWFEELTGFKDEEQIEQIIATITTKLILLFFDIIYSSYIHKIFLINLCHLSYK